VQIEDLAARSLRVHLHLSAQRCARAIDMVGQNERSAAVLRRLPLAAVAPDQSA
jgi:hypothetical protein